MNRQNIILLILENISDDDNIIEIVENYLANSDLEDKLLEAHRTLHIRNENYYEITVSQYSLDFLSHFRTKRTTMKEVNLKKLNNYFTQ